MLSPKYSILLLVTLLLTTAAVAQQAQVKVPQQSPIANSSETTTPTCADAGIGSNSALTPMHGFDVLKVERSLGFGNAGSMRVGAASEKPGAGPQVCSAYCLQRCGECPVCGHEELWDCTTCSCQPI